MAATLAGQCLQALARPVVAVAGTAVSKTAGTHADQPKRPPLHKPRSRSSCTAPRAAAAGTFARAGRPRQVSSWPTAASACRSPPQGFQSLHIRDVPFRLNLTFQR